MQTVLRVGYVGPLVIGAILAAAAPTVAQTSTHALAPVAPRAGAEEIVAFARLSVDIALTRDSIQKQLALPRNKTPQAQQQLRDQLTAQTAGLLRRAGMSAAEYRRRLYLVSTDGAARAVFDETIAKLTGAPLPGQVPAAVATAVNVPEGPAGVHIGHLVNAFDETPKGQGLLPTALAEARTAAVHAALAARDLGNLESMKLHAGHVVHAVDPTAAAAGPGLGYGAKRAALGIATHVDLAARAPGASPTIVTHAVHVGTSARNTVQRSDAIVELAHRVQAATSASEAAGLVSQLVSLTSQLVAGNDANADGRVTWQQGEGGLQQCEEHIMLMLAAEGLARPGG